MAGARFDEDTLRRLDAIAAEMSRRAANLPITRSAVARAAMERGVRALELELGIAAPVTKLEEEPKPARKPAKRRA
jgi:hypothetical protein